MGRGKAKRSLLVAACVAALAADQRQARAQDGGGDQELAQQLTNPIADLVSIPFQYNWRNGVGPDDALQMVLNIQPVVPISLTESWNLVGRFIVPVISQPAMTPGVGPRTGLGDSLLSTFFSPVSDSKLQWGVGPALSLPLTTDPMLGSGQWSGGPTGVALYLTGPWTFVLLANHLISFADTGDVDRMDVNRTFLQPVVAYTTPQAWTFSLQSETTIDWEAEETTVPINLLVSKLTKLGPLPMSVQVGGGIYADAPDGGPEWQLRLAFTILLPTAKKPD